MPAKATGDELRAQAEAAAAEARADAVALFSGFAGLAEVVTGKRGPAALEQLVRMRVVSQDEAARIWRRSGRQDQQPQEMTLQQYREQYGMRRPEEMQVGAPQDRTPSHVDFASSGDGGNPRTRAEAAAEQARYRNEAAQRLQQGHQLPPHVTEHRRRNSLALPGEPAVDLEGQQNGAQAWAR